MERMLRAMAVTVALLLASSAGADRQRLAPGTGTQDAIVIDTGANGLCESQAAKGDIQAANLGEGAPNENEIRCGPNRTADSTAAGDDVQLVGVGASCQNANTNVVSTGPNGIAETPLAGDDTYTNGLTLGTAPPNEACVITGANGVADTVQPAGDDVPLLAAGQAESNTTVVQCGPNGVADTTANNVDVGDDVQLIAVGASCGQNQPVVDSGLDGVATTRAEGPDLRIETVRPTKLTIKKGKASASRTIKLKLRNVEFGANAPPSRAYRIDATRGNCPRGTIVLVDADAKAGGVQAIGTLSTNGKTKAAVTIQASLQDVTTHDKRNPFRCTFNLAVIAMDTDPDFDDAANTRTNRQTVQLDVTDKNDL